VSEYKWVGDFWTAKDCRGNGGESLHAKRGEKKKEIRLSMGEPQVMFCFFYNGRKDGFQREGDSQVGLKTSQGIMRVTFKRSSHH